MWNEVYKMHKNFWGLAVGQKTQQRQHGHCWCFSPAILQKRFMHLIYIWIVLFCARLNTGYAQIVQGLTGVPDTSFNTPSAFQKEKKYHPQIQMPVVPASKAVVEKRNIVYHQVNKRKLVTDAFYPVKGKGNGIAVIIIHGGGWRSGNRTQHHDLARALAAKGYACFTPEYRLSTEAFYPAAIFDIKEAIKWIRVYAKDFGVDTAKLAVTGFSAGGQMAALIGCTGNMPAFENYDTKNGISTRVGAIIDIDGTLSFVHAESSEQKEPSKVGASAYWLGYTPRENPVLWASASPLSYAACSPPVLFLNSSVERMHAGRDDYIKVLKDRNVYSEVHTFENSPHAFCLFEPWFTPTVTLMADFLKKVF